MMQDANHLHAYLSSLSGVHTMCAADILPAVGESGERERRGQAVETIGGALEPLFAGASLYRILWSQFALLVPGDRVADVDRAVQEAIRRLGDPLLEARAIIFLVEPGNALRMLDGCLEELASRRNFGKCALGPAVRLIGADRRTVGDGAVDPDPTS